MRDPKVWGELQVLRFVLARRAPRPTEKDPYLIHLINRLLRILFLVALFRSANLPLRSLEAPPSCLGPHPKHRDRALLSRYRDTIARARASISMLSNQISLPNLHTRGRRRNDRLFPRSQKGARSSGCTGDASPSKTRFLRCRRGLQI